MGELETERKRKKIDRQTIRQRLAEKQKGREVWVPTT